MHSLQELLHYLRTLYLEGVFVNAAPADILARLCQDLEGTPFRVDFISGFPVSTIEDSFGETFLGFDLSSGALIPLSEDSASCHYDFSAYATRLTPHEPVEHLTTALPGPADAEGLFVLLNAEVFYRSGTAPDDFTFYLWHEPSLRAAQNPKRLLVQRLIADNNDWKVIGRSSLGFTRAKVSDAPEPFAPQDMTPTVKRDFHDDLIAFLHRKEVYQSLGAPYKRGYLLYGNPGNGKSFLLRHLVSKGFLKEWHLCMDNFFTWKEYPDVYPLERIPLHPTVLLLEDLDRDVKEYPSCVSRMLNFFDGLRTSSFPHGLIVIATSNYPDRLDEAFTRRPGRFDKTVLFEDPTEAMRRGFLQKRFPAWTPHQVETVTGQTCGFTIAALNELSVKYLLSLVDQNQEGFHESLMTALIRILQGQSTDAQDFFGKQHHKKTRAGFRG